MGANAIERPAGFQQDTYLVSDPSDLVDPRDFYHAADHASNLAVAEKTVQKFGIPDYFGHRTTPWLHGFGPNGENIVAIQKEADTFKIDLLSTRPEGSYSQGLPPALGSRLGALFVRDRVKLDSESIAIGRNVYPPSRQIISSLFSGRPALWAKILGGWFGGYSAPIDPEIASTQLQATLARSDLVPASRRNVSGVFAMRPRDLKYIVGVNLPERDA